MKMSSKQLDLGLKERVIWARNTDMNFISKEGWLKSGGQMRWLRTKGIEEANVSRTEPNF